ncbi:UDP-N-acetylglucosamine:LPS N-acetylglucosamine transferase [Nostoc sp. PCC 7524]|uniref:UDP-N-acetylglucosamine--LPS N-acetylglucosamine transferase n=1 Tax=Nostoc sp. (strain ATCC 29411 / PCC 7524) TaxID=28072 RepID=UPI00029ECA60|nr:UDP-N-acetylglucosamine--LPS N-acetylglucosamine transferase [Nostoc sp. PCC 7524]AFY51065.1 UDP-N-acetylglucosamine:LPS N-acetylglucosamine transferase [Nostoc sp. PCC 7524]
MTKTWLIYALGGGWGHLNRALSVGRIAAHQRTVKILTNSPYAKHINNEGCLLYSIPNHADFAATCLQIQETLLNTHYDCLIVDTFPRGLGGELVDILPQLHKIPRIFIHRDINPHYVIAKDLRSFVIKNFNAVIVPGEGTDVPLGDLPGVIHTAPWLVRNPGELMEQKTVRSRILRVDDARKIILVCAAGQASELAFFSQITLKLHQTFPEYAVRILTPHCPQDNLKDLWIFHHPGIECLATADVVVGGAGYNTVYECASVGVPLVALPLPRLYDRQQKRASKVYAVTNIEEALTTVKRLLEQIEPAIKQSIPAYTNGAIAAVYHIMNFGL